MTNRIIPKPTKELVFKAKLLGKPVDMIGGYKDDGDHIIYIDLLCDFGVLERTAWGVFVVYPIEVTMAGGQCGCSIEHTQILNPRQEIQEWGVFYTDSSDSLSYKKWMMGGRVYGS